MSGEKYYFVVMDVQRTLSIIPVKKNFVTIPDGSFILSFVADNLRSTVLNGHNYLSDLETYAVCTTVFDTQFLTDKDFMPERTFFVLPGVFLFCDKTTPAVLVEHTYDYLSSVDIAPNSAISLSGGSYGNDYLRVSYSEPFTVDGEQFTGSGQVGYYFEKILGAAYTSNALTIYANLGVFKAKIQRFAHPHYLLPTSILLDKKVRVNFTTGEYYLPDLQNIPHIKNPVISTNYMKWEVWYLQDVLDPDPDIDHHILTIELKPLTLIPAGQSW